MLNGEDCVKLNRRLVKLTPTNTPNYQIHSSNKSITDQIIQLHQILASASAPSPYRVSRGVARLYIHKRALQIHKRALKEPYISEKEPYISAKEPCISAKEPWKSPTYPKKSPIYLQKSPIYLLKNPKRALHIWKRVVHICKRAPYRVSQGVTGWWRCIGCLKLQVFSRKRAPNCRALVWKETYKR